MTATSTYAFGAGTVICVAGGVATQIGTLQDIEVDFTSTNVTLMGASQFPVAVARGEGKVQGKAKTGTVDLGLFSRLYLGQNIDNTGYTKQYTGEAHSIPATSAYTVTATNHTGGIVDLGVYYASGAGQLIPVTAGSEAAGKYSVNLTTGVYTFAAADEGLGVLISYSNFATGSGQRIVMTNQLMGLNPVFALNLNSGYTSINGVTYTSLKLFSCVSNKMTLPFKNNGFVVSEFDFDAFQDSLGNIAEFGIGT